MNVAGFSEDGRRLTDWANVKMVSGHQKLGVRAIDFGEAVELRTDTGFVQPLISKPDCWPGDLTNISLNVVMK